MPIAPERNVEIVPQEHRQRHVPTPPEFDDAAGLVRRVEVKRQEYAEHQRNADRHVAIAGEIKIKLESVSQRTDPCLIERGWRWPKGQHDKRLDNIGKTGLLEQTDCKNDGAAQNQMRIRPLGFRALKLRNHVLVVQDRSRDQMREISDEQRVVRQRISGDLAPVGVHQEGDLGKRVKRYSDRKQNVDGQAAVKHRIEVRGKEACIFEKPEHQKVAADPDPENGYFCGRTQAAFDQGQTDRIIVGDRDQQQRHELPMARCVEGKRSQRQPNHRRQLAHPAQDEIAGQDKRQEQENKSIGVEQHVPVSEGQKNLTNRALEATFAYGTAAAYLAIRPILTDINRLRRPYSLK